MPSLRLHSTNLDLGIVVDLAIVLYYLGVEVKDIECLVVGRLLRRSECRSGNLFIFLLWCALKLRMNSHQFRERNTDRLRSQWVEAMVKVKRVPGLVALEQRTAITNVGEFAENVVDQNFPAKEIAGVFTFATHPRRCAPYPTSTVPTEGGVGLRFDSGKQGFH